MKPKNQNIQPKEPKEDENSPEFRGYVDRSENSPMQDWAETSEDF